MQLFRSCNTTIVAVQAAYVKHKKRFSQQSLKKASVNTVTRSTTGQPTTTGLLKTVQVCQLPLSNSMFCMQIIQQRHLTR